MFRRFFFIRARVDFRHRVRQQKHLVSPALHASVRKLRVGDVVERYAKPPERLRVAMIFDCGASDDGGYNQTCREGVESLLRHFPVYANFVETDGDGEGDFVRAIAEMAERGYDLIVGVGVLIAPSIEEAAQRYPKTKFATVDGGSSWPAENVCSLTFKVDEAAFPAGYLAAAWAALKDPADPAVLPRQRLNNLPSHPAHSRFPVLCSGI